MATWLDTIKTDFTITCGDKAKYVPFWLNAKAKKSVRYNVSKFEFKGMQGSLVKRGTSQGQEYDIEIIFQGGDNLDVAKAFKKSADNAGAWTIAHPLYGKIYVQPVDEFEYFNGNLNQSIISGKVIETLLDSGLVAKVSDPDIIAAQAINTNKLFSESYASTQNINKTVSVSGMLDHVNGCYQSVVRKIANVQADVTAYQNIFNEAVNIITKPITATGNYIVDAITRTQAVITAPAHFADTIANRIAMFNTTFSIVNQDIAKIAIVYNQSSVPLKKLYENNGAAIISGICLTSMTNIGADYTYRPDVLSVIESIASAYNTYIENVVSLQTNNGGETTSYIPDADSILLLQSLVYGTIQALFNLSAAALQQRTYLLQYYYNLINVTYLLYGSDPDDTKKTTLIANNNIGLDELLVLPQGRKIVYYV